MSNQEPSDADLLKLLPEQLQADLATVSRAAAHGAGAGVTPDIYRVSLNTGILEYARIILARWGGAQPSGEGKVPTDEEIHAWVNELDELTRNGIAEDWWVYEIHDVDALKGVVRGAVARWGRSQPPAEGEAQP